MKIAIDGRALTVARTGGGYYTYHLLKKLLEKDHNNQYLLCAHKPLIFGINSENLNVRIDRFPLGILWQQIGLPHILRRERVDLFHSPLFTIPLRLPCPAVITIFDLTPVLFPKLHHWKVRLSIRHTLKLSARRASRIIAISESTRRDIVKHLRVDENKVAVIYPGVDTRFYNPPLSPFIKGGRGIGAGEIEVIAQFDRQEKIRRKYAGGAKFLLHVGTLEPRKNLNFLVDVYNVLIKKKFREKLHLVLAGEKGWGYKPLFKKVVELGIEDKVFFTGYVPPDELPCLYNAAEIFVFPSIYEGFGLPVLEAMASGVPVITSLTSSLPEVVGDGGLLIKGWNVEEWADAIYNMLVDEKLRQSMRERGILRSKKFSWEKCADETLKLYNEV